MPLAEPQWDKQPAARGPEPILPLAHAAAECDVWRVDLRLDGRRPAGLAGLLDSGERERAARFLSAETRRRFIAAHGALRLILGRELNVSPAEIGFRTSENGKPELQAPERGQGLRFNLSHSHEVALIAVCSAFAAGVDVERVLPNLEHEQISTRFFAQREHDFLLRLPEDERPQSFYALWTAREALIKAAGASLAHGLDDLEVPTPPAGSAVAVQWRGRRWTLLNFRVPDGYVGAVAADHEPIEFRFRNLTIPELLR